MRILFDSFPEIAQSFFIAKKLAFLLKIGKISGMRKMFFIFGALALVSGSFVSAQSEPVSAIKPELQPVISVDSFIPAGEKVLFDATKSGLLAPSTGVPVYSWDFGDGSRMKWGGQVGYEFQDPGRYTVKLQLRQGQNREQVERMVTIFTRKAILISDPDFDASGLIERAGKYGIWLEVIPFSRSVSGVAADEQFVKQLQRKESFVQDADSIIFYTENSGAVQGFAQWWQSFPEEERFNPTEKFWVQVSDGSLSQLRKLTQPGFGILQPEKMLLTRPESLDVIFGSDFDTVADELRARGLEYEILDDRASTSWLLPISRMMSYFVSRGVSQSVLFLLLAVPFITFFIAFARQVIGVRTFGVYAPLMLTLSFILLGLKFGFIVFAVVLVVSYLIRLLFDRVELLYIPKISLLLSALSLSFFLVLGVAVEFDAQINLALAVFPMLVMSTVSEKFLSAQSEGGLKSAVQIAGETVVVSLLAYGFVQWSWLQNSILAFPEVIILPIVGCVWIGRWTGLRLTEYFRFSALFGDDTREE